MKKTTKLLSLIILLMVINKITMAQWTLDPTPIGRTAFAGAANKKAAIFYGGFFDNFNISPGSNVFFLYNATTDTWTSGTNGKGRVLLAATSLGPRIYLGGGDSRGAGSGNYETEINIYNTDSMKWEADMALSLARENLAAAAAGSKVLFAGGVYLKLPLKNEEIASDVVDIYDTLTGAHTVEHLSIPRMELCGASAGNIILFAGGRTQVAKYVTYGVPTKRVDIYDVCTGTWTIDSLSQARTRAVAVACGTKIYIAGGQTGTATASANPPLPPEIPFIPYTASNVIDIYDVETKVWTTTTLSIGRTNLSGAANNNFVMFAGGSNRELITSPNGPSTYHTTVDIYDVANNTWTTSSFDTARAYAAAVAIDDKFFVAGGAKASVGFRNNVSVYQLPAATAVPTITVATITCKAATINWTSSSASNTLRYRKIGDCDWTDTTLTGTTCTISGLNLNTNYETQVRANSPTTGISDFSGSTNFATPDLAVTVPTGLAVSSLTRTDANLIWDATVHASLYTLQYKIDTASTWTTVQNISLLSNTLSGLTTNTNYVVAIKAKNACDSSTYSATVPFLTLGLGIDPLNKGIQFSIFPNPASEMITIISNEIKEKGEIKILNNLGQVVYNRDLSANISSFNINIEHLSTGFYTISFSNGKTNSMKKFVKE